MLLIHYIDDATGQPLCSTPESDRWLWTVNRRGVTCQECEKQLKAPGAGGRAAGSARAEAPAADSAAAQSA